MFGQDDDSATDFFGQTNGAPAPGSAGPVDQNAAVPQEPQDQPVSDTATTAAEPAVVANDSGANSHDELLDIKQEALQSLSPLVGHLDQSPEEKFRTTMMMIQASDDQSLLRDAYDAAKQISDEKTRAQALLDVVNEINYFTQQHNS
jgi:hypothetical protein